MVPSRVRPCGLPGAGATPTRSARTPLVVRPLARRVETPVDLTRAWACRAPAARSGEGAMPSRSHLTCSRPREGPELAGSRRPARAGPPAVPSTTVLRRAREAAARDVSLARTHREPRAASPTLPRRRARFAEPEVPSIGEPATPASTRPKPRVSETTGSVYGSPGGSVRLGTGGFPQVVTNLWKMVDAFCNLNGSAALDGASGERSSGDVAEG